MKFGQFGINLIRTIKRKRSIVLFSLIFFFSLFLRFWHMEYIPYQGDSDELAHVFAGQSLIDYAMPISWSSFSYPKSQTFKEIIVTDAYGNGKGKYLLVRQWFDHPFMLAAIEGWVLRLTGYTHFPTVPPSLVVRIPTLFFAAATLALVYAIAKELFGEKAALFSIAVMGFSPSLAFGQRMAVGENLFVPLILLAMYLLLKRMPLAAIVGVSVMAGLTKVTGLIVLPILVLYLILQKKYRYAAKYVFWTVLVFSFLYLLYAFAHGWPQFLAVFRLQTYRLVGWVNPAFIFSSPGFLNKPMLDASYYLILALGILPFFSHPLNKNAKWLFFSTLLCFLLVWATSAEQDMLGWYKLPMFTFLSISSGVFLANGVNIGTVTLVAITALNNIGLVKFPRHPLPSTETLRFVLGLSFGAIMLTLLLRDKLAKKAQTFLLIAFLLMYAGSSLYVVSKYYQAMCESRTCPAPTMNFRQAIKGLKL